MNPVLGVLNKLATRPAPGRSSGEDASLASAEERKEAALALARELFHAVEQFVISTPDLDTRRFLQRMRNTSAGVTSGADVPTLALYRQWTHDALGTFAQLQRRCLSEREDEMWRLLNALANAGDHGASSERRLMDQLKQSHGRMREFAKMEDIREARLYLEDEVRRAQKLVELKQRQDRERIAALQRQVTRLEAALAAVRGQADFDPLTGVFHRGVFDQRLHDYLGGESSCTMALIDVDNFKTVNDTLGHTVGDKLLAMVGENIHRVARTTDLPARYGGDEFAFVAVGFTAEQLAQRLSGAVARRHVRMEMDEGDRIIQVLLSTSVGIATSRPGDTRESLIHRTDQAMLAAKKAGKGGIRIAL